jgi:single stranded DNA-binding protein
MTEPSVSFAGNLTDQPEVRYTEGGIARAVFRVAVSGRREQEASFFTVVVWRDQAEHAAESLSKGSRVVVVGRLQQRTWTAEDGSARQVVEVVADERAEPALYAHKATVARAYAGEGLGAELLDWAGTRATNEGARWLRVDVWTTNDKLQQYYRDQGFTHVRTVLLAHNPSGAVFSGPRGASGRRG